MSEEKKTKLQKGVESAQNVAYIVETGVKIVGAGVEIINKLKETGIHDKIRRFFYRKKVVNPNAVLEFASADELSKITEEPIESENQDFGKVTTPETKVEPSTRMSKTDKIPEVLEKLSGKMRISENEKTILVERLKKLDISDEQMCNLESLVCKEIFDMKMSK
jgi:hypothetical protein